MALSLKRYNVCYLHCPKTGGSWVERALNNAGVETEWTRCCGIMHRRHPPRDALLNTFEHYFTFVRHPISWYESYWKFYYMKERKEAQKRKPIDLRIWRPCVTLHPFISHDFSDFIERVLQENPKFVTWLFNVYAGGQHRPTVNFVGRQERLAEDLVLILEQIGVEFDKEKLLSTPPVNVSTIEKEIGLPIWKTGLKRKVMKVEHEIMERFYKDDLKSPIIKFR